MNLKTIYTRGLAMFLSLVMIIGTLSLPALAADAEPLPDLTPPTEEELETAPTDQAYKDPFDEAKEADQLDGEKLDAVNKEIEDAVDTANQEIGEANAAADAAAAEAGAQIENINQEIDANSKAAEAAATEANSFAQQAKDTALSLEAREEAAGKAQEAAEAAKAAAEKADAQVTAAQAVVDAAQEALDKANTDYQAAIDKANELLEDANGDPGLKAQAEQLLKDAAAKVESAESKLLGAQSAFETVESARITAWGNSETARIAAEAAKQAAEGQQTVIDGASGQYGNGIVDSDRDTVNTQTDGAISAKELEDAAQAVVDAHTKAEDLQELDKLTGAQEKLESAKNAYDEADKALNGYTDENGNRVEGAQGIAKAAKDNLDEQVTDSSEGVAKLWLDTHYADAKGTNYRKVINAVLANESPDWLTEKMIEKVISDAKSHTALTQGGQYIVKLGETLEALRTARAALAGQETALSAVVEEVTGATGTAGTSAQEVLANLAGEIGRINDGGKYDAELENLTNAIETANTALDAAKNMYACKGGSSDVDSLDRAQEALTAASDAYSQAIASLNSTLKDSKLSTSTTTETLKALKEQKEAVDTARGLLETMKIRADEYQLAQSAYQEKHEAAQSAQNQYQAAKKAVDTARTNLENAKAHPAAFNEQDLSRLAQALENAKLALTEAETAKQNAEKEEAEARRDAEDAHDAFEKAAEDAGGSDVDPGGSTGNTSTGAGDPDFRFDFSGSSDSASAGSTTIEDSEIPLAGLISVAQLLDVLRRHEEISDTGLPEDFPWAGHEYAQAICWGLETELVADTADNPFDPDEIVTVAILRQIMTQYAGYLDTTFDVIIEDADDMPAMNCDGILAEFFAKLEEQAA